LSDDSAVAMDGAPEPDPSADELRQMTLAEALAPDPPSGTAERNPAFILGGGALPAPVLASKIACTAARLVSIRHPGAAPPERRYIPSAVLAWFVRARDLTCRFPGCDEPAHWCDLDREHGGCVALGGGLILTSIDTLTGCPRVDLPAATGAARASPTRRS
jgi:hypothetical protein